LGNAIDAEPKLGFSRTLCQQTVHDVVAHLPVHDVAALVSYPLSDGAEALRYLEQRHARGKIVLTIEHSSNAQ